MRFAILNIDISIIIVYGLDISCAILHSLKHAVYKLVGTVRSNLLHDHSAPPSSI